MPDQILHQAVLVADIKMVARFVQKQDRRVLQQGADDVGTLLFTARKPADAFIRQCRQIKIVEKLIRPFMVSDDLFAVYGENIVD